MSNITLKENEMPTKLEEIQKYIIVVDRLIQAHKAQLEALKQARIAKQYFMSKVPL